MNKDESKKSPRQKRFLTIPEVAEEFSCSERKVWKLIEDEELKVHDFGGSTRVSREDLNDYIARSRR